MVLVISSVRHRISIHAPREGCDVYDSNGVLRKSLFQSTHPVRGATLDANGEPVRRVISIHAPREGCDLGSKVSVLTRS